MRYDRNQTNRPIYWIWSKTCHLTIICVLLSYDSWELLCQLELLSCPLCQLWTAELSSLSTMNSWVVLSFNYELQSCPLYQLWTPKLKFLSKLLLSNTIRCVLLTCFPTTADNCGLPKYGTVMFTITGSYGYRVISPYYLGCNKCSHCYCNINVTNVLTVTAI